MSTGTVILRPEKLEVHGVVKHFPGGRRRQGTTSRVYIKKCPND